ncbi:VG15 protein [Mycobacteroides abscessus]|uniref:VG15 protein n=1 Tax=Mycobacteroides abscessus TaxID=36809 RepID=UPI001F46A085|nr:hypothetical protein [Mycobacteroides abscessus]
MVHAVSEFQRLLAALGAEQAAQLSRLLARTDWLDQGELLAFITDAYPEAIAPFLSAAALLTAQWYDEQPTSSTYTAAPAELTPAAQLAVSGRWAMLQTAPLDALTGSAARALFNASRETVLTNVMAEPGARWARHASANACSFCRLMATRGAVYTSEASATKVTGRGANLERSDRRAIAAGQMSRDEALQRRSVYRSQRLAAKAGKNVGDSRIGAQRGTRALGEKYHDRCHCIAVMVRPGNTYQPPAYVEQWATTSTRWRPPALPGRPKASTALSTWPPSSATWTTPTTNRRPRAPRKPPWLKRPRTTPKWETTACPKTPPCPCTRSPGYRPLDSPDAAPCGRLWAPPSLLLREPKRHPRAASSNRNPPRGTKPSPRTENSNSSPAREPKRNPKAQNHNSSRQFCRMITRWLRRWKPTRVKSVN